MRRIALWTAKLAKRGKRVKSANDANKMQTVPEKRAGSKIGGELSPMDTTKGLWGRNSEIGWTVLLLVHQFRGKVTSTKVKVVIY